MNKGRLYEELIPIEQLSYKGYNTPELVNAKIKQILDEVKKEMPPFIEKWLIKKTNLIGKQPVKLWTKEM